MLPQLLRGPDPRAGEVGVLCASDTASTHALGSSDLVSRALCLARCVDAARRGEGLGSRWVRRGGKGRGEQEQR